MHNPQLARDLDEIFQKQQARIERSTEQFVQRARLRRTERLAETLRAADADTKTGSHATGPQRPSLAQLDCERE